MAGLLRVGLRPETVQGDRRRAVPGDQQEPLAGAFMAVLLMGSALAAAAARMTPSNRSSAAAPAISIDGVAALTVAKPADASADPPPRPVKVIGVRERSRGRAARP